MDVSDEERVDVVSADGTPIAVWAIRQGLPLVLVHGSMQDHTANRSFVDALTDRARTWSVDRRGCGATRDSDRWSIDSEFDDLAAVIEAVAERTGEPVALWGHSFGAACAMGGAARIRTHLQSCVRPGGPPGPGMQVAVPVVRLWR